MIPTAALLFSLVKTASGGSAWDNVAEINDAGAFDVPGGSGAYARFVNLRTGDSKRLVVIGGYSTSTGYDAAGAWVQDGSEQRGFTTADAQRSSRTERYVDRNGWWNPQRDPATFESLGKKSEGGVSYDVVRVTPEGGNAITVWIDAKTHLIAKRITQDGGDLETTHLSDYASFGGILYPRKTVLDDNKDASVVTIRPASVRVLGQLVADDVARFTIPPCIVAAQPDQLTCAPASAPSISAKVEYFPLPDSQQRGDVMPFDIAKGPDGALWFTENAAGAIGRIDTAGAIREFPIPSKDSMPIGIAAAPDRALWFTECGARKIGRITTSGTIAEFALPPDSTADPSQPRGIAVGPDGALWFTWAEYNDARSSIGRITLNGKIVAYPLPHGWDPRGITAGSDGALWFTEDGADA